jgi:hypothetical protein
VDEDQVGVPSEELGELDVALWALEDPVFDGLQRVLGLHGLEPPLQLHDLTGDVLHLCGHGARVYTAQAGTGSRR